ncbi:hypothetical protein L2734_15450 [Parashewanella spongiae]|nr:RING finger domain-containing protein [Parashewanella spongiae]MCL1079537.1 hypothetical protein [Parashewanella spongiae]
MSGELPNNFAQLSLTPQGFYFPAEMTNNSGRPAPLEHSQAPLNTQLSHASRQFHSAELSLVPQNASAYRVSAQPAHNPLLGRFVYSTHSPENSHLSDYMSQDSCRAELPAIHSQVVFQSTHCSSTRNGPQALQQARKLFCCWQQNPQASLQINNDQIMLTSSRTEGLSPFELLEWVAVRTYNTVSITAIARYIGLGEIVLVLNDKGELTANLNDMQKQFNTLNEHQQISFIASSAYKLQPVDIKSNKTNQMQYFYTQKDWSYPPNHQLQQVHHCRFGAIAIPCEQSDELTAIHHCLESVSRLAQLTYEFYDPIWQSAGVKPPYRHETHELYAHAFTAFNNYTYGDNSGAYQADLKPYIRQWLAALQPCCNQKFKLSRLPRYQKLCAANSASVFLRVCGKHATNPFPSFRFLDQQHLILRATADENRLCNNLSQQTAITIIKSYRNKISIDYLRLEHSTLPEIKAFLLLIQNLVPEKASVSMVELAIYLSLNKQPPKNLQYIVPPIIASAFLSLDPSTSTNILAQFAYHKLANWLVKQEPTLLKLEHSGITLSQLQQWARNTGDEFWDHTLSVHQRWLIFASTATKTLLYRAECDLFNTNMTPPPMTSALPCPSGEECVSGLINTPIGLIAPLYFRKSDHELYGHSGADCELCKTAIFRVKYDGKSTASSKQPFIAHCAKHEQDICEECLPTWLSQKIGKIHSASNDTTFLHIKDKHQAELYILHEAHVVESMLLAWLSISKIAPLKPLGLEETWITFAENYPELAKCALIDLTETTNVNKANDVSQFSLPATTCCENMKLLPVYLVAANYNKIIRNNMQSASNFLMVTCDKCENQHGKTTVLSSIDYQNKEQVVIEQNFIAHCTEHQVDLCVDCCKESKRTGMQPQATASRTFLSTHHASSTAWDKNLSKISTEPVKKVEDFVFGCPICLNPFKSDSEVVKTNCGHTFCISCFDTHSRIQNTARVSCPTCRNEVTTTERVFLSFIPSL